MRTEYLQFLNIHHRPFEKRPLKHLILIDLITRTNQIGHNMTKPSRLTNPRQKHKLAHMQTNHHLTKQPSKSLVLLVHKVEGLLQPPDEMEDVVVFVAGLDFEGGLLF